MSKMMRLTVPKSFCAAALATALWLWAHPKAVAQDRTPPTSGGENFSANKPPAALFASDCTGAGCHKGPQGLGRKVGIGGLASFLREHYTNSRESAASLANYLSKMPSAPDPRKPGSPPKPAATAAAPAPSGSSWIEGLIAPRDVKPAPSVARQTPAGQTPAGRTSRAAASPNEDPATGPATAAPAAGAEAVEPPKPGDASPKPSPAASPAARAQRGRQPAATATAAAPPPPHVPEVAPTPAPPPAPPAPPAPKQFDIFD